ncbi:hypothetical protein OSB04_un000656 [Centaurea solstitialis]|uniref:Uncharacterized protein n=1 Tax=Centaurea solstitialis TaxID=347529 RepID=A0AA38SHL5_9ASTR|nr:hypothetical protein OSB04_un000656 [Centaurea solstitialis]
MDCSQGLPCENVEVSDIHLTYNGARGGGAGAISECSYVKPKCHVSTYDTYAYDGSPERNTCQSRRVGRFELEPNFDPLNWRFCELTALIVVLQILEYQPEFLPFHPPFPHSLFQELVQSVDQSLSQPPFLSQPQPLFQSFQDYLQ